MPKGKKTHLCKWGCGRTYTGKSGICDFCWLNRLVIWETRKAKEREKPKRERSERQREHLRGLGKR